MATLKTLVWNEQNKVRRCRTTVIDLDRILFVQENDYDNGTCTVVITKSFGLNVDIPLDQMRKIMDEHQ